MANRKLQSEIERTLKKVSEGLDIFHETLEKLDGATSPAQKEKIEIELKKEIKKLQRLRDLIKNWQTMSEIKDKGPINDARRLIELEMERFKVLEKEMKIKAYSKEGLSQAAKMDPKEQGKLHVAQWINGAVDKLNTQTDALEAELESLQINARKSKRLDAEKHTRLDVLPSMVERHKLYVRRLEQLLRMMENDKITSDEVNNIRDDVEYYIDSNQEPDFIPDDDLFDQFSLDDALTDSEGEQDDEKYDDAVAQTPTTVSPPPSVAAPHPIHGDISKEVGKKKPVIPDKTLHSLTSTLNVSSTAKKVGGPQLTPQIQRSTTSVNMPVVLPPAPAASTNTTSSAAVSPNAVPASRVSGPSFASAITAGTQSKSSNASQNSTSAAQSPHMVSVTSLDPKTTLYPRSSPTIALGPYSELFAMLQKRERMNQIEKPSLAACLEASWQHSPDGNEAENRSFSPKQPLSVPSYYPTTPSTILENPAIFERFELDTLFFVFYYQQRTYAQYFAARELKRQSWRFHKKYLTWFQRHEEPKIITEDFEQGTYIYFDYEGSWCQRKKSEFTFEYRFLEDEDTI